MSCRTVSRIRRAGVPFTRNAEAPFRRAFWARSGALWREKTMILMSSSLLVRALSKHNFSKSVGSMSIITRLGFASSNAGQKSFPDRENPTTEISSSWWHRKRNASIKRRLLSMIKIRAFLFSLIIQHHIHCIPAPVSQTSAHSPESGSV